MKLFFYLSAEHYYSRLHTEIIHTISLYKTININQMYIYMRMYTYIVLYNG